MSKQDIEKRLGFAAQGVKAEMGSSQVNDSATTADLIREAQRLRDVIKTSNREFDKTHLRQIKQELDNRGVLMPYGASEVLASRPGVKAKFGNDSISVNMIAKRMVSKLKKIVPNEGLEQFHKRLLTRISEIVKSTDEAIRNPDNANLQWTIQELKDVIRDEAGSSGSLNRATGVWLGSRPGVKAKMALTISTVGAKNLCYEALANLKEMAKLAAETNSGWDFHVNVMTDHVKDAIARMETKPTQAATDLDKAVDTLGMLKKIEPKRLNDIQKGSLKQLIGYVAKSLRDARANIKVVTTASRPGVKAKFEKEYVLWGLPKGETDAIHQQVLSTQAKTPAQMEDVKKRAAAAGWHSFRVQILDLSKPYKGFSRPGVKAKA